MGAEHMWLSRLDYTTFDIFNKMFTSSFFNSLMPIISNLTIWVIPLGILWLVYFIRSDRRGRLIALCCFLVIAATDQLSSGVIKPFVERNRPCNSVPQAHLYLDGRWFYTDKFGLTTYKTSPSFPSSHAANVAGQAMYWGYFYPQISPLLAFAAVMVGFSRVYMGLHWPTDVAAGYLLGVFIALLIAVPLRTWFLPEK